MFIFGVQLMRAAAVCKQGGRWGVLGVLKGSKCTVC